MGHYYAARVECPQRGSDTDADGLAACVNRTAMNSCIDALARDFHKRYHGAGAQPLRPLHARAGTLSRSQGTSFPSTGLK